MIDPFAVGVAGMFCILLGFLMHLAGKWTRNLRRFIFLEMVGSAMLAYYAWQIDSLPFLILNAVMAAASAYGLLTSQRNKSEKHPAGIFEA